jgi:hypothetical protein
VFPNLEENIGPRGVVCENPEMENLERRSLSQA